MNEDITKAIHSMQFVVGSLQDAINQANAVESMVLLDVIESAATLQRRIEPFSVAIQAKE